MPDVLIFADSIRSPEMRHEVPIAVPDPFLYAEQNGRRIAVVSSLEAERIAEADGSIEVFANERFGLDELLATGKPREEIELDLLTRACKELGVSAATVPAAFPLALADHLRANGVELRPDGEHFTRRGPPASERRRAAPARRPFPPPAPRQARSRARRHPPGAAGRGGRHGRGARPAAARRAERGGPRARRRAADLRAPEARRRERVQRARRRHGGVHRLARRPDRDRPRDGPRP